MKWEIVPDPEEFHFTQQGLKWRDYDGRVHVLKHLGATLYQMPDGSEIDIQSFQGQILVFFPMPSTASDIMGQHIIDFVDPPTDWVITQTFGLVPGILEPPPRRRFHLPDWFPRRPLWPQSLLNHYAKIMREVGL